MTSHQYALLRALSRGPRTLRSFTHAETLEQIRISPAVIEHNLARLVDAGYVALYGSHYYITDEGAAQIDLSLPTAPQPISTENYSGTKWRIRLGGEDFLKHKSFGTLC